jgi:hypothetical protein
MAQFKLGDTQKGISRSPNSQVAYDSSGHTAIKAALIFLVQGGALALGFWMYLQLHKIKVVSALTSGNPLGGFGFVDDNVMIGGVIEVLFWSSVATTLRRINIGDAAPRRKGFDPLWHLIDWAKDLLVTSLTASVIAYCLRSPRLILGTNIDLSLDNANVGVFVVLGFLLGSFKYAPGAILVRIWNGTLGPYSRTRPLKDEEDTKDKHDDSNSVHLPPRLPSSGRRDQLAGKVQSSPPTIGPKSAPRRSPSQSRISAER